MAHILVVAMSAEDAAAVTSRLRASEHDVIVAAGFEAAIHVLDHACPDLLITQVRLGAFNGLHLVIRSHVDHLPMRAILLDSVYDAVLERDAQRHGAAYLVEPVGAAALLEEVSQKLAEISPERQWPRERPPGTLVVHVAERPARVVDLSYDGVRLELPQSGDDVPSRFAVTVPGHGVVIRVRPVWTHRAPSGWLGCGAQLSETNPRTRAKWRRLVDSVGAAA
jgi:DNA-binding response OmpR family regulator